MYLVYMDRKIHRLPRSLADQDVTTIGDLVDGSQLLALPKDVPLVMRTEPGSSVGIDGFTSGRCKFLAGIGKVPRSSAE